MANLAKKESKRMQRSFYKVKKVLFQYIYLYMYIYIYLYISIYFYKYLYLYIEKKNATYCFLLLSFAKERNVLAFFYFLCKRLKHFLCSFTFFAKERCVLCVLLRSLQKNVAFYAFFYVLKKRMQKNASVFWVS